MKKVCGVNPHLYKKYEFNDHIWYQNCIRPDFNDLLMMAQQAVKINNQYWMKKAGGVHWISLPNLTDAEKEALNTWQGILLPSNNVVDSAIIHTFFHGEQITFNGTKVVKDKLPNIDFTTIKV